MSNKMLKINSLSLAVGLAVAIPSLVLADNAYAGDVIAATHIYHNHMPNFWPYYNTSEYEKAAVGTPIRYTYDGQVFNIKNNPPADYPYFLPKSGEPMPHDNLQQYYDRDAKRNAYTVWPAQTANANHSAHPLSQTQVTMSAAVINNVQSFAELNIFDFYKTGWSNDWKSTVGSLKTTNGFNALEPIHFTGHHSMGPLVGPKYFLKDLIYQNVTLQQDYFLGSQFKSSKGFFPTELGFSERLIPTLAKLGIEWSVVGNNHFSRALTDYPYNYSNPSYDTLVSPPNRADLQNTFSKGGWEYVGMNHEQQTILNQYPFCAIPHWVQYIDPNTGKADKIAAIPVDQNGSWTEGWEGIAVATEEIDRPSYNAAAGDRTMYFVIAHDGDNGEGRAGSISTWLASGEEYSTAGVVGMGVEEYLKAYPIPADDIQHIQDGSWVDTRDSSSDPDWYHWHIPMGVWTKGQLAAFNKSLGTDFEAPKNFAGTSVQHAVSMEYGYHYLERNFALLQAAENYAETAEQIWLDDHPNYWSPSTEAEKQVTYSGNQLNPYMMSYPVKGDESNDYKGGANPAELGWYFLISSIDSGFGYYDENTDDNVKPSLGFNQSLYFTEPYVKANISKDKTGPSMWWVQRYPTNPGSANSGKAEGWTPMYADNVFAIYTYAYDVSGIKDVKVYVRPHKAKSMKPTDIAPRVYNPKSISGADASQVGEWKEYPTKVRDLTPDMNGVDWQVQIETKNYEVLPAKKIGSTYYAYISDYRDQLVDYYMEATDNLGNVTKSEINHTYVGAGRYNLVDGAYIEDVDGEIEGSHMFFTDGSVVSTDTVTLYAKTDDDSVTSVYAEYKDKGASDWNSKEMKQVSTTKYFKTSITYTRDATCADIRVKENGSSSYYNGANGNCLSKGTYIINKDGSITEGAPHDIVTPVTFFFKPASELSKVCVHYRGTPQTGDKGWTTVPGVEMSAVKNGWWSYTDSTSFGAEISGLEFLFNDCGSQWFKSSSGGNFTSATVGDVWVDGTKMGSGIPAELDTGNKSPVAVISASALSIKKGESATLDASGSSDPDGSIVAYKWSTGETTAKITVTPEETTKYTVTVTDNDGATATKSVTINVDSGTECEVDPFWYLFADFDSSVNGATVTLSDSTTFGKRDNCDSEVVSTGIKVKDQCLYEFGSVANNSCGLVYKWDFGDGTTSDETFNVSHTYEKSGTYDVVLKIYEGNSVENVRIATKKVSVEVSAPVVLPVAKISASKTEITRGETVTLDGSASTGDDITYKWNTGATTPSITVTPDATSVYTLQVVDKNGNKSEQASVTITVTDVENHAPKVTLVTSADNSNRTVKSGTTVVLDASGSTDEDGDELSYLWSNQKTSSSISETLYETTTFTVNVTDSNGATTQGSATITVVPATENMAPVARISAGQTEVSVGSNIVFDGSRSTDDKAVKSYEWSVNGNRVSTNSSLTYTFNTEGTYLVSLTVYDEEGLSGTESVSVRVVGANVPVVEFTLSGDTIVDLNKNVLFTTTLVNAEAASYVWYIDGEKVTGSDSSLNYVFTTVGSHEVKAVVTDKNNEEHRASLLVTVSDPYVNTPVGIDAGSDNQTEGNKINFVQSSSDDTTPVKLTERQPLSFIITNISHEATVQVVKLADNTKAAGSEQVCQIFSGGAVDCSATDGVDYLQVSNDTKVYLKFIQTGSYQVRISGKNLSENDFSGYIPLTVTSESTDEPDEGSTDDGNSKSSSGGKGGGAIGIFDLILMAGAGFFLRRRRK